MAITEKQRQQLFARAEEAFGSAAAATMMELIGAMAWDDLAKDADLRAARVDIEHVKGDVAELKGDVAVLRREVTELRIDLERHSTRMAKTFVGWMLASQTSLVGLVALIVSIGG